MATGISGSTIHPPDLRQALVAAAAELAAESGSAEISLRAVARRAGVSEAAPYYYFADKAALLAAVAVEGFARLDQAQAAAMAAAGPHPGQRLAALGVAYLRFAVEQPHYFGLMFRAAVQRPADRYPDVEAVAGRVFDRLVEATRAARQAAGHDDADADGAALVAWAAMHGLARLWLDGPASREASPRRLEQLLAGAVQALAGVALAEPDNPDGAL
ncbi:MAG: TetR-like C-terminal domain-containing protein [Acidobacteriota bacterium]